MPHEGEFAKYRSIRRLVENDRVKGMLKRAIVNILDHPESSLSKININDLQESKWQPELVLAIDGSHQEIKVENGFPGAEISYVTVASVLMDLEKIREIDRFRPIDPKVFRTTENADSIDAAFPGCNVILDSRHSAVESLRLALFEVFSNTKIPEDGDALIETYEVLAKGKHAERQICPYGDECKNKSDKKYTYNSGTYQCTCSNNFPLYSTDSSRIYEGMVPDSANGAMFAEIMQTLERVLVIHILRWLEKENLLSLLQYTGIVMDGPLALFGHVAGLLPGYIQELNRLNKATRESTNGIDILLIGIEKSGFFVNHFNALDQNPNGTYGAFPNGHVALIDDTYIKENIIFSRSSKEYGKATYFGRKFFYKTNNGARLVGSVPFLDDRHKDLSRAEPEQYPRLSDALNLLDQLVSSRYPNSLSPLISAHAEAAIPMNLGSKVLKDLAKKHVKRREA
jgi:hypothetical protein